MPVVSLARALSQSPVRLTPIELHQLQVLVGDCAEEVFFFHTLYAIGFPVGGQAVFTPDIGIRKDTGERVDLAAQLLRRGFVQFEGDDGDFRVFGIVGEISVYSASSVP